MQGQKRVWFYNQFSHNPIVARAPRHHSPIHNWPSNFRPREKLLLNGVKGLSDAELLAILLRVGTAGQNAVEFSSSLLRDFGGIHALLSSDLQDFSTHKGIGIAKWSILQASQELVRRGLLEKLKLSPLLNSSSQTREFLQLSLGSLGHEEFACFFLDKEFRLIAFQVMFRGNFDQTLVYPKEILKETLKLNAQGVILAHNHPNGIAHPSGEDIELTQKMKNILESLQISLVDHCIVTKNGFFSFSDAGML